MIKNLLLLIFGIISLIAILCWLHIGPCLICKLPPQCDDSKRYDDVAFGKSGGGTAISDAHADTLAEHFKNKYVDSTQHAEISYFSKKAIDHLFAKHPTANAIGCIYSLVNDSIVIVINSYRIEQTEIDIPDSLDHTYIVARAVCPPSCPPAPK